MKITDLLALGLLLAVINVYVYFQSLRAGLVLTAFLVLYVLAVIMSFILSSRSILYLFDNTALNLAIREVDDQSLSVNFR